MKTKILKIAALGLILFASFNAVASPEPANSKTEVISVINHQITYPVFAKDQNITGMVGVKFSVDKSGNITILELSATDNKLGKYVEESLKNMQIQVTDEIVGEEITTLFKFRIEKN